MRYACLQQILLAYLLIDIGNELYRKLSPVAADWKLFGVQLGLELAELDKLVTLNKKSEVCFLEMMKYYMDNGLHQWEVSNLGVVTSDYLHSSFGEGFIVCESVIQIKLSTLYNFVFLLEYSYLSCE